MNVIKRDGRKEAIKFDKITSRIQKLCYGLSPHVDPVAVAMRVIEGLYDGVSASEPDCLSQKRQHPWLFAVWGGQNLLLELLFQICTKTRGVPPG
jgi:ATP cone domain.